MSDCPSSLADRPIVQVFDEKARINPQSIFAKVSVSATNYAEGFRAITYLQITNAVNQVAQIIDQKWGRSSNFECLAYIGPSDLRYVVVLLACIKTGYKVFFSSPRNSQAAHTTLLTHLKCEKLLCTTPEIPCIATIEQDFPLQKQFVPSWHELLRLDSVPHYPYDKTYEEAKNDPIFVLHTSGSTGIPKPLTYRNSYVSRVIRAGLLTPPEGFRSLDINHHKGPFFTLFPLFHIAGQILMTMHNSYYGSYAVYPLPSVPPTTEGFIEALQKVDVEFAVVPPVIIDDLGRNPSLLSVAASRLKFIYFSGGSVNLKAGGIVNAQIPVYQVLGSSENGGVPQIRSLQEDFVCCWDYVMPHPDANTDFRNRSNGLYELVFVKKAKGEQHLPVFSIYPHLDEFETKDLFSPHPTVPGLWRHAGRVDDVIVFITGEKTNSISFEQEVANHPYVRAALVTGHQRFEAALLIELKDPKLLQTLGLVGVIEKIWPTIQSANNNCPAHAKVSKSMIIIANALNPFARAAKGTVIRQASISLYDKELDLLYTADSDGIPRNIVNLADEKSVLKILKNAVENLLGITGLDVTKDFFSLGMDSLQVLQLERDLKHKLSGKTLSTSTIYGNPSVKLLAMSIINLHDGSKENPKSASNLVGAIRRQFEQAIDGLAMSAKNTANSMYEMQQTKIIILTGSTSSLGSYILQELLSDKSVAHIYCLNRASNSLSLQFERNKTRGLTTEFPSSRVTFLTANLAAPAFGLEKSTYDTMSKNATHIIHNAWPVDFNRALQSFQPSLKSLVGLIAFAATASLHPALLFLSSISSAFNYKTSDGVCAPIPEIVLKDDTVPANTGYGQSKYIAERILDYASQKFNLTSASVRVAQVAGPLGASGHWNRNEWFPSLVISSRYINALPDSIGVHNEDDLNGGMSDINWVLVDQMAAILVELGLGLNSAGMSVYHAINPNMVAWKGLVPIVQKGLEIIKPEGTPLTVVSFEEWIERLKVSIGGINDKNSQLDNGSVYKNPGVKLLEFYEGLARPSAGNTNFEYKKTIEASQKLRNLEAIKQEWMVEWINNWFDH